MFHRLQIIERRAESKDGFSLALQVPENLRGTFSFQHGQYLTVQAEVGGEKLRRSYSICNGTTSYAQRGELRIGIKRVTGGAFSSFAFEHLTTGEFLDVMPPQGRFTQAIDSASARHYVGFAAGSGITPILSTMQTVLELEPKSRFTLVYGNRSVGEIMFLESIEGLKNRFMDRVRLLHVLSQQPQESELFTGRIDAQKVASLGVTLVPFESIDLALICGPDSMIDEVEAALLAGGLDRKNILSERFGTPTRQQAPRVPIADLEQGPSAQLKVILDGKTREMRLPFVGTNVLDVALNAGLDLPYACKGGVCCTCRAKVLEGEVRMEKNYTLEQWEIDKGFVLTCQCVPISDAVTVSYDER